MSKADSSSINNNVIPAILGGSQTRKTKLYYGRQWINEDDVKAVAETITSVYITCGPKVDEFEHKLAGFCGAKYAVAVTNDTSALYIACILAGVGPGDVQCQVHYIPGYWMPVYQDMGYKKASCII